MAKLWISAVLGLSPMLAIGQGRDNLWMGGHDGYAPVPFGGSSINFVSGVSDIYYDNRPIDIYHTTANICDADGNLLFFTNGVVVGRADGDTMQNGTGLNPSDYTDNWYPDGLLVYQANLILPDPGNPDRYYLFHSTVDLIPDFTTEYLYLSVVDMTSDGGNGAIVSKNQVVHTGGLQPGRIAAVRHGNGRDWWVYVHELNNALFLRWLVSPEGVTGPTAQSVGTVRPPDAAYAEFAEDGDRFVYYSGEFGMDLFDVDRCSGNFSHVGFVDVPGAPIGIGAAFSGNGRFLYLSAQDHVYQVDADAADLQASLVEIAEWDSTYSPNPPFATKFGASKLAPDGKIYISTMNSTDKLHVINYPDSLGAACDIQQHAITLPTYWKNSLPNHPNYHLGALDGSICDSLDVGITPLSTGEGPGVRLYPNPNNGAFAITFAPQAQSGWLEVHALDGRLVHREPVAAWSQLKRVEVPRLAPGMYQCKLRFGGTEAATRFVVE